MGEDATNDQILQCLNDGLDYLDPVSVVKIIELLLYEVFDEDHS